MVHVNWDLYRVEKREGLQPNFHFKQNGGFGIEMKIVADTEIEAWEVLDYTVSK